MAKQKTHSASKKRFKISASGKAVRTHGHRKHKLTGKSAKRKRNLKGVRVANKADQDRIKKLIPYK